MTEMSLKTWLARRREDNRDVAIPEAAKRVREQAEELTKLVEQLKEINNGKEARS